jgi:ATP-dependent Lon protease
MARRTNNEDPLSGLVPVMPLRSTVVYPLGVIGVQIGIASTLEMLSANGNDGLIVAAVVSPGEPDEPIDSSVLNGKIAVAARVSDRLNLPGGTVQATVQGLRRVRLRRVQEHDGWFRARVEPAAEIPAPEEDARSLIARTLNALEVLAAEVERIPSEVPRILRMNLADPGRFADLVAALSNFSVQRKDEVLQQLDIRERLGLVTAEVEHQLGRLRQIAEEKALQADRRGAEGTTSRSSRRRAAARRSARPIPCIVGPPDVGKRSLVAAIARGLGRPLARVELGGRGEAQLVGTRRTRAGAQPGKIISALRDV